MQANTAFGNLTAQDAAVTLALAGYGGAAVQIAGTFSATVTFEASVDGVNWRSILGTPTTSSTQASTATNVGVWFFNTTGLIDLRARCSAYTNGTAEVKMRCVVSSPASPPGAGGGGGGGTSSDFGEAFPATGTAAGFLGDDGNMAPGELAADGSLLVTVVSGGGSNASVGATGNPVPASATAIGVSDASGDLQILASVSADYNSTTPPVVPISMIGIALPGAGGPVAGGTSANPFRTNVNSQAADDAAVAGNPVRVAGMAKSPDGTSPGAVAEGDTANLITDLNRRLLVNTQSPQLVHVHLNGSSAYSDQALFPDPGDGFQTVMTFFQFATNSATLVTCFLEEGSTTVWGPIALEAVAGRGYVSGPIHVPFTASTAVTVTTNQSVAQSIDATYFVQAV